MNHYQEKENEVAKKENTSEAILLCVLTYTDTSKHSWVPVCVRVHESAITQRTAEVDLLVFLDHSPPNVLRQGLSLNPANSARMTGLKTLGIILSPSTLDLDYRHMPPCLAFSYGCGI